MVRTQPTSAKSTVLIRRYLSIHFCYSSIYYVKNVLHPPTTLLGGGTMKLYPGLGLILPASQVRNSNGFKGYGSEGNRAGKSRSESKRLGARYLCEPIHAPGFQRQEFSDSFPSDIGATRLKGIPGAG